MVNGEFRGVASGKNYRVNPSVRDNAIEIQSKIFDGLYWGECWLPGFACWVEGSWNSAAGGAGGDNLFDYSAGLACGNWPNCD